MSLHPQSGLPPSPASIRLTAHDLARLDALLETPTYRHHPGAAALQRELDRADVLPAGVHATDIVGMHTNVACIDEHDGSRHQLTLVYPHEADASAGRISVLAPVGAALLGLTIGQRIDWPAPNGGTLQLRVLFVSPPAEL